MKFFKFNFLKDEVLLDSAPFIQHIFYPKGSVIFREGERSSKFYIIGRGKISMRVKKSKRRFLDLITNNGAVQASPKNNEGTEEGKERVSFNFALKKKVSSNIVRCFFNQGGGNNGEKKKSSQRLFNFSKNSSPYSSSIFKALPEDEEEERIHYSPGDCFGEWAIIYNQPRSASAYVVEDSDLFYLEKQSFSDHLAKLVVKSDVERKLFIKSRIPTFNSTDKFDIYYKRIVPLVNNIFINYLYSI